MCMYDMQTSMYGCTRHVVHTNGIEKHDMMIHYDMGIHDDIRIHGDMTIHDDVTIHDDM